jgi:hypothetical protein
VSSTKRDALRRQVELLERLAALLHENRIGCNYVYNPEKCTAYHADHAARLIAAGVSVYAPAPLSADPAPLSAPEHNLERDRLALGSEERDLDVEAALRAFGHRRPDPEP